MLRQLPADLGRHRLDLNGDLHQEDMFLEYQRNFGEYAQGRPLTADPLSVKNSPLDHISEKSREYSRSSRDKINLSSKFTNPKKPSFIKNDSGFVKTQKSFPEEIIYEEEGLGNKGELSLGQKIRRDLRKAKKKEHFETWGDKREEYLQTPELSDFTNEEAQMRRRLVNDTLLSEKNSKSNTKEKLFMSHLEGKPGPNSSAQKRVTSFHPPPKSTS